MNPPKAMPTQKKSTTYQHTEGFTTIPNSVLYSEIALPGDKSKPLSIGAKFLYLVLLSLDWDRDREVEISYTQLANLTGISRRAVVNYAGELTEAKLLGKKGNPAERVHAPFILHPLSQDQTWLGIVIRNNVRKIKDQETKCPKGSSRKSLVDWFRSAWWPARNKTK